MDNDEKEIRQRYSGMTMEQLVDLHRNPRLPAKDETIVDEILEFRGVSKDVRQKLKNSPIGTSFAPDNDKKRDFKEASVNSAQTYTISKEIVSRPLLVSLIALLALWRVASYTLSALDSRSIVAIIYFFSMAVLSIFLAYGLWDLKPWVRKFMISYCSLIVFMSWLIILLLYFFGDSYLRLSLDELSHSTVAISGKEMYRIIMYKSLIIRACITSVIYVTLVAYFFKKNIRQLFE